MKLSSWIPEYWNDQHREVWSNLEKHWEQLISANVPEFLKFIHPDFIGYGHESPLPVDRPWLEKWVGMWAKSTKILICELRPIQMKLHGSDLAVLQYFIFTIEQSESKTKHVIRRYTMTWKKQPERWVVIASHNNLMNDTVHG
jgi:hypothetical protein